MKSRILKSKNGQFYFVLLSKNSQVLVTSETYTRKSSAKKIIQKHFPQFKIEDLTK